MNRRGAWILLATLIVAVIAAVGMYRYHMRHQPDEWLGRHLGLEGAALQQFTEAHHRYAIQCGAMCERVAKVNARLTRLVAANRTMTPDIRAAIAEAETLRAECKQQMLSHFYEVARLLDPRQANEYLRLVLPLITGSDRMETASHHHP